MLLQVHSPPLLTNNRSDIIFGISPLRNLLVHQCILFWPMQLRGNLIPRNDDPRPTLKKAINILQRAIGRLGIKQVRDRDETETYNRPDDPKLPPKALDPRWRDLDDHVIHNPVRRHGQAGALGAHLERVDLGGIQPGYTQNTHPEASEKHEEERHSDDAELVRVVGVFGTGCERRGDDNPTNGTCCGAAHHNFAAPVTLDDEVGEAGEKEVVDGTGGSEDAG